VVHNSGGNYSAPVLQSLSIIGHIIDIEKQNNFVYFHGLTSFKFLAFQYSWMRSNTYFPARESTADHFCKQPNQPTRHRPSQPRAGPSRVCTPTIEPIGSIRTDRAGVSRSSRRPYARSKPM
jgi:hypothetical protein